MNVFSRGALRWQGGIESSNDAFAHGRKFQPSYTSRIETPLSGSRLSDCAEDQVERAEDPELLSWAAEQNRILITHDINTIPKYAYERIKRGLAMSGVIVVPKDFPIGQAIEELLTIIECSDQSEYINQVLHIPL